MESYLIDGSCVTDGSYTQNFEQWQAQENSFLWLDINFENDLIGAQKILESFGIHPLASEDAFRDRHPPKIEFFEDFCFIIYRGIRATASELRFEHLQLAFFIGERYLITVHRGSSIGIDTIRKNIFQSSKTRPRLKHDDGISNALTPMGLALNIMHSSSSVYLERILTFDNELSDIEDEMAASGSDELLSKLTAYKSQLVKLRRVFNYHRGITETLVASGEVESFIPIASYVHTINDLHERFDRLFTLSQMHYDICGDLMDGYLSISSHRLNETMRVLTVITAIFIPLGFLAGLYGMNFEYMPELQFRYSYFFLLGTMLTLAAGLLFLFRRKKWL
ncbi:magnesium transporter CorA family protein [Teredinibacter franksiae]|uniref:magnesium transporter CorA family protein n=1 Tax=Teredinibacter franksiae TaxID=2761453 RepID=UPI00162967D4|nr:magnesium transporter CorA family protein [Teredinibacter franksiae]